VTLTSKGRGLGQVFAERLLHEDDRFVRKRGQDAGHGGGGQPQVENRALGRRRYGLIQRRANPRDAEVAGDGLRLRAVGIEDGGHLPAGLAVGGQMGGPDDPAGPDAHDR